MKYHWSIGIFLLLLFQACSSKSEKQNENNSSSNYDTSFESSSSNYSDKQESDEENEEYPSRSGCRFEDETYSATVDYYNPETSYRHTYTLDIEVENCEVVQINFPNDGWLDNDHITPAKLDEDGSCTVDGEDGKTYEIQINK